MKLHQLRYLSEIAKCDLSVSNAAIALHTSQPGISKQIRLLEQELGVELLVRSGNRIVGITPPGRRIIDMAGAVIHQTERIKLTAHEFSKGNTGLLVVAATFTLARYVLPRALKQFVSKHPAVELKLLHGSSDQVCRLVVSGEADIGLSTQPAAAFPELLMLEHGPLPRALLVPVRHPLTRTKTLTLKAISAHPLITLDAGSHGQARMRALFVSQGLEPNILLSGANIDVVKAFVEAGLGVAVLPRIAFDRARDTRLRALPVEHLFEPHRASIAIRKDHRLRAFGFDFVRMLTPKLDSRAVDEVTAKLDAPALNAKPAIGGRS